MENLSLSKHSSNQPLMTEMTEEELARELKTALLVLTTSSDDKRKTFGELFSLHAKDENHHAGLDLFFTDSGALAIAPKKTPEKTGAYIDNLNEKAVQQFLILSDKEVKDDIRSKLAADAARLDDPMKVNIFNHDTINIVGITEDSGWDLVFADAETEKKFIGVIIRDLTPKLREQDSWILNPLYDLLKFLEQPESREFGQKKPPGFPGPNLKPLQEHLEGGFGELMDMIYNAADELNLKELRYSNATNVAFVSPRLGKYFEKTFTSEGRLLRRNKEDELDEYENSLMDGRPGEAINSNFVHIPDGQASGEQKTVEMLIRAGLHTKSSKELPASYARRDLTEWLQDLIGKRRSSRQERKRRVNIAYVTPQKMKGESADVSINRPDIHDLTNVGIPTKQQLMRYPGMKNFDDADVVVLIPENVQFLNRRLHLDPNWEMLLHFVDIAQTDPVSMGVPIVLDNRSGGFYNCLQLISDVFLQGQMTGDAPFYIANTDAELKHILEITKDIKQRAPQITIPSLGEEDTEAKPLPDAVPNDGVFTVFIAGGHANNSKRDLEDAKRLGYYCAIQDPAKNKESWRIVTGAGSIEGSMGAVHTGFIQYHLDELQKKSGLEDSKAELNRFMDKTGHYDAEKLILERPDLVDKLADQGHIPRHMFYGFSTKALLEMESPSAKEPPGITYFDAGNMTRRKARLLAPGTKIILRGAIGTYDELDEAIRQHIDARAIKTPDIAANDDTVFADGTPNDDGAILIYNPKEFSGGEEKGHLDKVLRHYGISGGDRVDIIKKKRHNIKVTTSMDGPNGLLEKTRQRAETWRQRIDEKRKKAEAAKAVAMSA